MIKLMGRKGFTLVEIMIVVAIIALLAAIAIPNLLRARLNANETAAMAALHTIASVCTAYHDVNYTAGTSTHTYPIQLSDLGAAHNAPGPAYIDPVLETGTKQGYTYTFAGAENAYTCLASPVTVNVTGERSFFVDQTGVVRWHLRGAATVADPPVE